MGISVPTLAWNDAWCEMLSTWMFSFTITSLIRPTTRTVFSSSSAASIYFPSFHRPYFIEDV